MTFSPAIRNRLDHKLAGKTAAGLVEYEFSYITKDYQAIHDQSYYSNSSNFVLGERVDYFDTGSTTLKGNIKFAENENPGLNAISTAASLSQNVKTFKRYILTGGFTFENQKSKDPSYDQRSYKFNFSYGLPALIWGTNLDLGFNIGFTDVINSRDTRGLEKNFNPTATLTKTIDRESHFSVNLNYGFTKNSSMNRATYAYTKHVVGLGGSYTF